MRVMGIKTVTDNNGRPMFYLTLAKPGAPDMTRATVLSFYQVGVMLAISGGCHACGVGLMKRQFVEPVDRLVALAERLGSGHMDARHGEPYDKGEVGELAKAFDDMADALEERTAELEYLSYHDSLTGAYNRTYMEKIMDDLDSEENIPTTVIMGDINGLKTVNDTLGHEAGNKLIVDDCGDTRKVRWGVGHCCPMERRRVCGDLARCHHEEWALAMQQDSF